MTGERGGLRYPHGGGEEWGWGQEAVAPATELAGPKDEASLQKLLLLLGYSFSETVSCLCWSP